MAKNLPAPVTPTELYLGALLEVMGAVLVELQTMNQGNSPQQPVDGEEVELREPQQQPPATRRIQTPAPRQPKEPDKDE